MCERIDLGNGQFAIVCGGHRKSMKQKLTFPATHDQLKAAGWNLSFTRRCKLCNAMINFWRTPAGKTCPMDIGPEPVRSHFETCPQAEKFRKPKAAPAPQDGLFK